MAAVAAAARKRPQSVRRSAVCSRLFTDGQLERGAQKQARKSGASERKRARARHKPPFAFTRAQNDDESERTPFDALGASRGYNPSCECRRGEENLCVARHARFDSASARAACFIQQPPTRERARLLSKRRNLASNRASCANASPSQSHKRWPQQWWRWPKKCDERVA